MMTIDTRKPVPKSAPERHAGETAKLFMHGRSQAVRLPKDFRLPGKEVRVSRQGNKVILEPIARTREDVEAMWADIDALRQGADLFSVSDTAEPLSENDRRRYFDE